MIGVFDSGSGGLTVLQALRARAPNVDLLYFGDLLNAPYGNKGAKEIETLTLQMIRFLRAQGATHLVSACNSISATVIRPMLELCDIQVDGITEMVGPTVDSLTHFTKKSVVFFTTHVTEQSGMYQRACAEKNLNAQVIAIPELAGLIEANAPTEALLTEIQKGLTRAKPFHPDVIVLGCTHFPLIQALFEQATSNAAPPIFIYNPAVAVATDALRIHGTHGTGKTTLLISRDSKQFRRLASDRGFRAEDIQVTKGDGLL